MAAFGEPVFRVGDTVVFTNASRRSGRAGIKGLPLAGTTLRVTSVFWEHDGAHLRWEGMPEAAGAGVHCSEFELAAPMSLAYPGAVKQISFLSRGSAETSWNHSTGL